MTMLSPVDGLATKPYLAELESRLRDELRSEINGSRDEIRSEIRNMDATLHHYARTFLATNAATVIAVAAVVSTMEQMS